MLGIIGRGYWGDTYARTLTAMGVEYWQAGRDWREMPEADGIIIASSPRSHCALASYFIDARVPVIIEKPICLGSAEAVRLLTIAERRRGVVFCGHTRLYSPLWRKFKASVGNIETLALRSGGPAPLGWLWDRAPHLVAMCLDLGFDPLLAQFIEADGPITVTVNGSLHFTDGPSNPSALEVLISEFSAAQAPQYSDLELGVRVIEALEQLQARRVEETMAA